MNESRLNQASVQMAIWGFPSVHAFVGLFVSMLTAKGVRRAVLVWFHDLILASGCFRRRPQARPVCSVCSRAIT